MEITRGDTFEFRFQRKNQNKEVITEKPDKMYFTVNAGASAAANRANIYGNVGYTGEGQAMDIMNPYIVMKHIIKVKPTEG